MSDQHNCEECPVALLCPENSNLEKYGFKIIGGVSLDLSDAAALAVISVMTDEIEKILARLKVYDWYAWHAARCVVKSRELHHGHASFEAIIYFTQTIIEMINIFGLASGSRLLTRLDYDWIELEYRSFASCLDPEVVAVGFVDVFEEQIVEYAEVSANNPFVERKLRRQIALYTMLAVRALMETGALRDLDKETAAKSKS